MSRKKLLFFLSGFFLIITLFSINSYGNAQGINFPAFGKGSWEVYLFTDYFCPPCRSMEPQVEPILKELLKKNLITLYLVDVPFSQLTPLYARYFLYAVNANSSIEYAFFVRNVLIEAAATRAANTEEKLINFLRERSVNYQPFNVKEVFSRYNKLITDEKIDATPTCIVVRSGKKEKAVGVPDILSLLKQLM